MIIRTKAVFLEALDMEPFLRINSEVLQQLKKGAPVVALETSYIAQGFPYPDNNEIALTIEETVRANNAVPASIAIINGTIQVGLSTDQIKQLAHPEHQVVKVSRRDISATLMTRRLGSTTVSSTMIAAHMAGIKVFATGGIGGVHRGAEASFDISADLQELAQTPVAVVCAGPKIILDLKLTAEYLETMGVPLVGYQTSSLPAFYTRISDIPVDLRLENVSEVAQFIKTQDQLGLNNGVLITNPVPEVFAMEPAILEKHINVAVIAAEQQGVKGKKLTPFLLKELRKLTEGESLTTNIELLKNNAKLAAEIACQLSYPT